MFSLSSKLRAQRIKRSSVLKSAVHSCVEALESRQLLSVSIPAGYETTPVIALTLQARKPGENKPLPATTAAPLANGVSYFVKASGTYNYEGGSNRQADAGYHQDRANASRWVVNGVGLTIPGVGGWGAYDAQHQYGGYVTGAGTTLTGEIKDSLYSDNSGSLKVEFFRKKPVVSIEKVQDGSEAGPQPYKFKLTRVGDLSQPLAVDVRHTMATLNPIGAYYGDFAVTAGMKTFAAGQSTIDVSGWVADDHRVEGTDTINLWIAPGSTYTVGAGQTTIAIADNDVAGTPPGGGGFGAGGIPVDLPPDYVPPSGLDDDEEDGDGGGGDPTAKDWVDLHLGAWWNSGGAESSGDELQPNFGMTGESGESHGQFILLNNDFDETTSEPAVGQSPTPDLMRDGILPGDGEVVPMTFGFGSDEDYDEITWTLEWDSDKVKIWTPTFDDDGQITGYAERSSGWSGSTEDESDWGTWWWANGCGSYVEGVEASDDPDDVAFTISVTVDGREAVEDTAKATVISADLGFNNADTATQTPSPDADFTIDATDDLFDQTGDGVKMWWGRSIIRTTSTGNSSLLNTYDMQDMVPFRVDASKLLGFAGDNPEYRFSAKGLKGGAALEIYESAGPDSRIQYLTDPTTAAAQIAQGVRVLASDGVTVELGGSGGSSEFVIRPNVPIVNGANQKLPLAQVVTLSLDVKGEDGSWHRFDDVKLTLRPAEDFWAMWSTRGPLSDSMWDYPTEDGQHGKLRLFGTPSYVQRDDEHPFDDVLTSASIAADPDRQVLIFVHGYNTSEQAARRSFDNTYKRLFWTGYRGAFVGFNWQGDDGRTPLLSPDVLLDPENWRASFDPNVKNAFRTAPALHSFLTSMVPAWTGNHPENVNLLAHSLGNLVTWEALRLAELMEPAGTKVANNVISSEAAIWKEAFEPETELTYPSNGYTVGSSFDNITYSIDEQKRDSWRFWFRQKDGGQERDIKRLLTGKVFNSFNSNDYALTGAMRLNDYVMRGLVGSGQYIRGGLNHLLHRKVTDDSPFDGMFSNDSLENIAGLMSHREAFYGPNVSLLGNPRELLYHGVADINLPLGATDTTSNPFFDVTIDANADGNWPLESHGAAFYDGDVDHDGSVFDTSFPAMWQWYRTVFAPSDQNNQAGAIVLGNS